MSYILVQRCIRNFKSWSSVSTSVSDHFLDIFLIYPIEAWSHVFVASEISLVITNSAWRWWCKKFSIVIKSSINFLYESIKYSFVATGISSMMKYCPKHVKELIKSWNKNILCFIYTHSCRNFQLSGLEKCNLNFCLNLSNEFDDLQ